MYHKKLKVSTRQCWAFVEWQPDCSRSVAIARRLGMRVIRHYRPFTGHLSLIYKYPYQFIRTIVDLFRFRPSAVICMSPPPLTAFPVWVYCKIFRRKFAIDAHTSAFIHPRWEKCPWIQQFFSRRAMATFVTNTYLKELVESAGGRALILPDAPTETAVVYTKKFAASFNVMFAPSYNGTDEPLGIVLEAAIRMPDVQFYFSGKLKGEAKELLAEKPANVHLLGFLARTQYVATMAGCDIVLALTTRNHTMQRAAYEAIYLGKPVVLSDWPVLRQNFPEGCIFIQNTAHELCGAVNQAWGQLLSLQVAALRMRRKKLDLWSQNAKLIYTLLQ